MMNDQVLNSPRGQDVGPEPLRVTNASTAAAVGEGTTIGRLMVSRPITDDEFGLMFDSFGKSAWRLELLAQYLVKNDPGFQAFVAGALFPPGPDGQWWRHNEEWRQTISQHRENGRSMGRVHLIPDKITPYFRYEVEWGYSYNALGGDDIRFVEPGNVSPALRALLNQDFWIFDDSTVVLCDYQADGTWVGARIVEDKANVAEFIAVRELAIRDSIDLQAFLVNYRAGKYSS